MRNRYLEFEMEIYSLSVFFSIGGFSHLYQFLTNDSLRPCIQSSFFYITFMIVSKKRARKMLPIHLVES